MKRLAILAAVIPTAALAHPGGHHFSEWMHILTEPDHLAMIGAGVAVVAYGAVKLRSRL